MQSFFEEVIGRLTQCQVEFVVVGGVSAVLQGVPIVTQDIDLCYRRTPENIARIAAALSPLQPKPRGFPADLPFIFDARTIQLGSNFTLVIGNEELDLLGEMSAIGGYEQIVGDVQEMIVAGFQIKVLSLAQLIATKEAAGRVKDHAVLPVIKATLKLKQSQDSSHHEPPASS
jgi:hypothetical protein